MADSTAEALVLPAGTKKTISVNRQAMQREEPGITIKWRGKTYLVFDALIGGPSVIRHTPSKKRQPRAFIVTKAEVTIPKYLGERLIPE